MAVPVTAVPVLPRHHQAATESALTMLANASPLSGLHKLAVSICARKKGPLCSTLETNPPMLTDNANPVTPLLDLSAPSDKATLTTPRDKSSKAGTKSSMSHSTGILPGTAVAAPGTSGSHASKATVSGAMAVLSSTDAAVKSGKVATGEVAVRPVKVPRTWDQYVAAQLQAGPDKQRQAKLVALLKKELARPGVLHEISVIINCDWHEE